MEDGHDHDLEFLCVPYQQLGDPHWWAQPARPHPRHGDDAGAQQLAEPLESRGGWLHARLGTPRSEALASMLAVLSFSGDDSAGADVERAAARLAPAVSALGSAAACPEEVPPRPPLPPSPPPPPSVPPDGPYELFTGWPGYRVGDMYRSASQRGKEGGAAFHCATWPASLACLYLSAAHEPRHDTSNDVGVMTRLVGEYDAAVAPPSDAGVVPLHVENEAHLANIWPRSAEAWGCPRA